MKSPKIMLSFSVVGSLLLIASIGAQGAESARMEAEIGDQTVDMHAQTDGDHAQAEIDGVRATVDGGDVSLKAGSVEIKVESGGDGRPKLVSCTPEQPRLRLTGDGSSLKVTGDCEQVDVETTAAMVEIDSARSVVITGSGNMVTISRIDSGSVSGTGNSLQWRKPRSVKHPTISVSDITNGVAQID